MVWTNNAFLTAVCVATGITGIGPVYFLASNAISVGADGRHDGGARAPGRVPPAHRAARPARAHRGVRRRAPPGLRIFWTWIDPGPRTRGTALAQEARALFTVAIGLVGVLAVSGLIEGFVTGSGLPWAVKIAHRRARPRSVLGVHDRARSSGRPRGAHGRPRGRPRGLRAGDGGLSQPGSTTDDPALVGLAAMSSTSASASACELVALARRSGARTVAP